MLLGILKHQMALPQEKVSSPNVNSAKIENLYSRTPSLLSLPSELQLTYRDSAQMSPPP